MRLKTPIALLIFLFYSVVANAQDRVSINPGFKAGDENRYTVSASVETIVTPKGADGIGGSSRGQLTATVSMRVLSVKDGQIEQEAVVEAISFSSNRVGSTANSESKEVAGKKIEFGITPGGQLLKCVIPDSPGYLALADLLFSVFKWYPRADVNVGGTWDAVGRGSLFTERLSDATMSASTTFKLSSISKGLASIDGAITLQQSGSSIFNPGGGNINVSVIANGKGSAHVDVDVGAGRLIGSTTESRVEGTLVNIQPTAAGEKMNPREGSLVEIAKFSIKLIE
jgi:hypothetical protein